MRLISLLAAFSCLLFPVRALAQSTICTVSEQTTRATVLAWDTSTKVAKFTDTFKETYVGTLVLIRSHNSGQKINLHFDFGKDHYGVDSADFIIFPINDKFRVIGAAYATVNGRKYLTQSYGEHDATCVSI